MSGYGFREMTADDTTNSRKMIFAGVEALWKGPDPLAAQKSILATSITASSSCYRSFLSRCNAWSSRLGLTCEINLITAPVIAASMIHPMLPSDTAMTANV